MKAFGYEPEGEKLLTLGEVTFQASAEELKSLALFINKCADEMKNSDQWEHEHFSDFARESIKSLGCEVIIFKP